MLCALKNGALKRAEGSMQVDILVIILTAIIAAYFLFIRLSSGKKSRNKSFRKNQGKTYKSSAKSIKTLSKGVVLIGRVYVVDGDTLTIQNTQVRLFGIDAPELDHPYGKNAKGALLSLCKGHDVRAEIIDQDTHGRTVARCYLADGRDLSAEMVKLGLAIDWAKFSNGQYRSLELPGVRKKLWLADARQKGRMDVWEKYAAKKG